MSEKGKPSPKASSIIVELEYPFEFGEEGLVKQIELKRPKGKHIKGLTRDVGMTDLFRIASKVSGMPPSFFDEMDVKDCMKVTEVIGDFLDIGPETGRTA